MSISIRDNLKNITIVKENDVITAIDVPSYYKTFMENLGCIPTSTVDVWVVPPMVLVEVEKFLKTCNVNSGFAGFVKREWTERVKLNRKLDEILFLSMKTCRVDFLDSLPTDVFDKLDVITEILKNSL